MIDLAQLRCFLAVADELHFGRAAARLHMTQPPLSRQIQLLEHAVGVQLLERTSRSVRLTAAGTVFRKEAAHVLRLVGHAADAAQRTAQGAAGRVVVGYTAVAGYMLVPSMLASVARAWPGIEIVLEEMVSSEQLRALQDQTIDLAFLRPVQGAPGLEWRLVSTEPMVLAVPAKHGLAHRRRVRLEDLAGEALVMYSQREGKYFHDKILALFSTSASQPRYVHHIAQTHTIMSLVRAGIGLAIVPASARHLRFEHVVFKPLWRDDVTAEIHLAWRAADTQPALRTVRDFVLGGMRAKGRAPAAPQH